jgi:TPR repeat protein
VFLETVKLDRKLPKARNGCGLAHLGIGKRANRAIEEFRNAAVLDKNYDASRYNVAMVNLAIRSREIGRKFERLIEKLPDHPDALFKLGACHESGTVLEKDPDLVRAADAYRRQVDVNPDHSRRGFNSGVCF